MPSREGHSPERSAERSPGPAAATGLGPRLGYWLAQGLSVVTHPMLLATYILLLLLAVNPYLFGVNSPLERLPLILIVFGSSFLMPGLVIVMMRGLEIIPDITMPAQGDRTLPLIAVGALYMGLFAFCRKAPDVPVAYTALLLGCSVALFAAFFANLFTKISLHSVGMGGLIAAVLVTIQLFAYDRLTIDLPGGRHLEVSLEMVLLSTLWLAGLVGTVRLYLRAHDLEDVIGGYVVGFTAMGVSVWAYF